jgi:hypothetical protein
LHRRAQMGRRDRIEPFRGHQPLATSGTACGISAIEYWNTSLRDLLWPTFAGERAKSC